jgi:uroporphyrinogen-III synthase
MWLACCAPGVRSGCPMSRQHEPGSRLNTARVIVTRPERDALRWAHDFEQLGLRTDVLPLLTIVPLPPSPALKQVWQELDQYAALMFVSGNAVDCFFASALTNGVANALLRDRPGQLRFMAPGPGTVAALRGAGVSSQQIDTPPTDAGQFDSEALWAVVGKTPWQGKRVLIVRGQSSDTAGRDWLAQQLRSAGAQVDFVAVYQRCAPVFSAAQQALASTAAHDGSVWLFSSSEAVAHLPERDWSQARAVATHPRIAAAVRAAGWGVVAESRPTLQDIVASIESLPS